MKKSITHPTQGHPGIGGGYWVNMGTVDYIRAQIPKPGDALGVFLALNIIVGEKKSATFEVTAVNLGHLTGGDSQIRIIKALAQLEKIGVIRVEQPKGFGVPAMITVEGGVHI